MRKMQITISPEVLKIFGVRQNAEDLLRQKRGGGYNARLRCVNGVLSLKSSSRFDKPRGDKYNENATGDDACPEMFISGIDPKTGVGTFEAFENAPAEGNYAINVKSSRGFHLVERLPAAGEGEVEPAWGVKFSPAPAEQEQPASVADQVQTSAGQQAFVAPQKPVARAKKELATA